MQREYGSDKIIRWRTAARQIRMGKTIIKVKRESEKTTYGNSLGAAIKNADAHRGLKKACINCLTTNEYQIIVQRVASAMANVSDKIGSCFFRVIPVRRGSHWRLLFLLGGSLRKRCAAIRILIPIRASRLYTGCNSNVPVHATAAILYHR